MKYKKALSAAVFVLAGIIAAGTAVQLAKEKNAAVPDRSNPADETAAPVTEKESYFLVAEENYLNLYVSDSNGALKKSERLSPSIFPDEDIAELRKGIVFDDERKAYEMMENFVE